MIKYVTICLVYLAAISLSWVDLRGRRESPRATWTGIVMLAVAWAWMIYAVSTMRPANPLAALAALLHRIPWLERVLLE